MSILSEYLTAIDERDQWEREVRQLETALINKYPLTAPEFRRFIHLSEGKVAMVHRDINSMENAVRVTILNVEIP